MGTDASGSVLDTAINWGSDYLSKRLYLYSANVSFTVAASTRVYDTQDTAVFGKRLLCVDRVVIGGSVLREMGGQYGLYTIEELDAWYPTWRTVTTGTPEAACFTGPNLIITPPSSGAISNSFVQGQHLADSLSASGDVSELPIEVHELIPYLAAYYVQMPVVDTEEAWQRLLTYRSEAAELVPELYVKQYRTVHGRAPLIVPGVGRNDS